MRNSLNTLFASTSSAMLNTADDAGSVTLLPETSPAAGSRILPDVSADKPAEPVSDAMRAHIEADGKKRAAAKAKADKPADAKPAKRGKAKPETEQPKTFGSRGTYAGPSPTFRMHERKLSPIRLDTVPGSYTERDRNFLRDLFGRYGDKPFARLDCDAGNCSRAIGHGFLRHAGGPLDSRTETKLQLTAAYIKTTKPVTATKAKAAK